MAPDGGQNNRGEIQMNAPMTFPTSDTAVTRWLVLRCAPAKTMALVRALNGEHLPEEQRVPIGAWTPVTKTKRKVANRPKSVLVTTAWLPSFIFIPEAAEYILDQFAALPLRIMRDSDGTYVRSTERQLESLRRFDPTAKIKARDLPKPGEVVRIISGPFEGLTGDVVTCSITRLFLRLPGFGLPVEMPPCLVKRNVP